MIELKGIEEKDLYFMMELRNKYKEYLRQSRILNMKDQLYWFNNNNDIIYSVFDKNKLIGAAGFTYIDYVNRKAELSFITENYIDYRAEVILTSLVNIGFNEMNMNKLFCEIYETDIKKIDLLEKMNFEKEAILKEVYYNTKYYNSFIYSIIKGRVKL